MSKEKIVYWAPHTFDNSDDLNWNILYKDIKSLNFYYNKNIDDRSNNFMKCPSVTSLMKSTFVIENPMQSSFIFENDYAIPTSKNYINANIIHKPTIQNNILFKYELSYYFFSEENLELTLTSPYFHKTPHTQYGCVVPGRINISSWFRPVALEFNLWNNVKEMTIEEDEPIAYISFNSDEKIILKRFQMNQKLNQIAKTVTRSSLWQPRVSLAKRYERFKLSKTNTIVLNEIKKNLVE